MIAFVLLVDLPLGNCLQALLMDIIKQVRKLVLSESLDELIKLMEEEKAKLGDLKPLEDPGRFGLKKDTTAGFFSHLE